MANEINLTCSLSYFNSADMAAAVGRALTKAFNQTGTGYVQGTILLPTTATVIPLGGITTPGWGFFFNLDLTNKINLRNGSTGASVVAMLPGEFAIFRYDSVAVPYGYGNIASCLMEYIIVAN